MDEFDGLTPEAFISRAKFWLNVRYYWFWAWRIAAATAILCGIPLAVCFFVALILRAALP